MRPTDPRQALEERAARTAERAGVSRREVLSWLASGAAGAILSGCDRSPAPGSTSPSGSATAPVHTASATAAASSATAAAPPRTPILKPTPASLFILHGDENAEMRLEAMTGDVTPNDRFFVRTHGATPVLDARTWHLSIEGPGVERPYRLTYDELLRLPARTVTRCIDCAGNGRSFYKTLLKREASGDPWLLGAWGMAEWTGATLSEILRRAGLKPTAQEVLAIGLDAARVERPLPIAKALEEDTLVAYRMNGAELPPDHGFPARVLVPGWAGVASIKWIGTLHVSEAPVFVKYNTEDYVLIGPDYPPRPPAKGAPITTQVIKSAVALPWPATLPAGKHTLAGYAWSPHGKIARVDVSLDGGRTFKPAHLAGRNIERAGVRWELTADLRPGQTTITPRATDAKGTSQPDIAAQRWNEKGYLFGAMVPHPLIVT